MNHLLFHRASYVDQNSEPVLLVSLDDHILVKNVLSNEKKIPTLTTHIHSVHDLINEVIVTATTLMATTTIIDIMTDIIKTITIAIPHHAKYLINVS